MTLPTFRKRDDGKRRETIVKELKPVNHNVFWDQIRLQGGDKGGKVKEETATMEIDIKLKEK